MTAQVRGLQTFSFWFKWVSSLSIKKAAGWNQQTVVAPGFHASQLCNSHGVNTDGIDISARSTIEPHDAAALFSHEPEMSCWHVWTWMIRSSERSVRSDIGGKRKELYDTRAAIVPPVRSTYFLDKLRRAKADLHIESDAIINPTSSSRCYKTRLCTMHEWERKWTHRFSYVWVVSFTPRTYALLLPSLVDVRKWECID